MILKIELSNIILPQKNFPLLISLQLIYIDEQKLLFQKLDRLLY
jgi:hypothetical protein